MLTQIIHEFKIVFPLLLNKVEPVRNGVIPVNKHGNVEVWDYNESLVPPGAR